MEANDKNANGERQLRRTVKDTVFTDLFSDKNRLLQLYRALHPEDTTIQIDDLCDVTLQNTIYDGVYNDLGMRVRDTVLILVEAQSTWSPNIVLRLLIYCVTTYWRCAVQSEARLYGSRAVNLPKPELYAIFTGERSERPELLSMSDVFFAGQMVDIDVTVHMFYESNSTGIIQEYVRFTKVFDMQRKLYGPNRRAIEEAIRICISQDILKDYLEEKKDEVMDILDVLFDNEYLCQCRDHEMREQGREEGREEERFAVLDRLLEEGLVDDAQISRVARVPIEEVVKYRTQRDK